MVTAAASASAAQVAEASLSARSPCLSPLRRTAAVYPSGPRRNTTSTATRRLGWGDANASGRSRIRSTDATVYSVAEGTGKAHIGSETFTFGPRDTFVVPSWQPLRLEAQDECVLFSYSDRSAQLALGLWREQRGE